MNPPNPPAAPPEWAVKAWNEICDTPFPSMSMFATGRECLKARAKVAAAIIARHAPPPAAAPVDSVTAPSFRADQVKIMNEFGAATEADAFHAAPVENGELVERLKTMRNDMIALNCNGWPNTIADAIAALEQAALTGHTASGKAETQIKELKAQRENMCVFIARLCRQSYKLGLKNKLTADAMDYINKTDAENTPTSRLLRKILPE